MPPLDIVARMVGRQRRLFSFGSSGFSLIEIITALAILGVLASIAIPGWVALLPGYRLNSSARQVQSELHRIKMQAISERVGFQLVFTQGAPAYTILRDRNLSATKPLADGILIAKAGKISFSPQGTASGDRVRLTNANSACTQVVVSATGRIRICRPEKCHEDC